MGVRFGQAVLARCVTVGTWLVGMCVLPAAGVAPPARTDVQREFAACEAKTYDVNRCQFFIWGGVLPIRTRTMNMTSSYH